MSTPPGPWHAEPHGPGSETWSVYAPDRDPNSENDGVIEVADYLTEEVARLVAAAPDLLAALKALVAAREGRHLAARAGSEGLFDDARTAIALAEGRP